MDCVNAKIMGFSAPESLASGGNLAQKWERSNGKARAKYIESQHIHKSAIYMLELLYTALLYAYLSL